MSYGAVGYEVERESLKGQQSDVTPKRSVISEQNVRLS